MLKRIWISFAIAANPLVRAARRLARREDGAAAVEFAMVLAPFLALTFAILETALIFFAGQTLETATADASRLILTGQADSYSEADFKKEVCKRIYALFDCSGKIIIDVRTYANFAGGQTGKPIKDGKMDPAFTPGYEKSNPGQIVVVRIMYYWPVYVSLLGLNLSDISDGSGQKSRMLLATAAFRNEPYK